VAADYEYFLASPAQLAGLDLAKSPLGQLGAERAAELPGIDPTVVLLGLVEVLSTRTYDEILASANEELAYDGGEGGPWVTAVDDFVVNAIRGADGDPELEWEDAVDHWSRLVRDELEDAVGGGDVDEETLLEITDELRRLCGEVDAENRLYCWTAL
jgi:hypothetical protein